MHELLDIMRRESLRAMAQFATAKVGFITSYDPTSHRAKVNVMPQAVDQNTVTAETAWLPIATTHIGNGWGIYAAPAIGDQVVIVHQEGHHGAGIIVGRVNNDAAARPPAVPSGEIWLMHSSKSRLKFLADGTIQFVSSSGSSLRFLPDGALHVQGDLYVTGDVYDRYGSLDRLRASYNAHAHIDPQGGVVSTTTAPVAQAGNPDGNAGQAIV